MRYTPTFRWGVAFVIGIFSALCLAYIWFIADTHRQVRVLRTLSTLGLTLCVLLAWLLAFSGFRWRTRWLGLGAVLVLIGLGVSLFRVRGVTGDLVPVLGWRFSLDSERQLETTPGETSPATVIPEPVTSNEYPQFLGPRRDAVLRGARLARDWVKHPPRLVWKQPIGAGWSAFAIAGNSAFTQEQRGDRELVVCRVLLTGEIRWMHADKTRYESLIAGLGPRATPTVTATRVFTQGATGLLNCLDRESGKRIWQRNVLEDNAATRLEWGMSGSPLVVDDRVVISAGGAGGRSLVAYRVDTGEPLWQGGDDRAGYSSPALHEILGESQIVVFNGGSVAGHDPRDGTLLWQENWEPTTPNVAQPVQVSDHELVVSSGYGVGAALIEITRSDDGLFSARKIWMSRRLKAKFATFVRRGASLYGLDDGVLTCVDIENGSRRWKRGRYGHGQLILVEDLLLILSENGSLHLVEAGPAAHRELSSFQVLEGKSWNSPALAAPYLLVRNDQIAACYELPVDGQ